ncbi:MULTISPECIES: hypothetical protein [Psychrilyobacter]|uniref:HMA domain-containing protein n=1 Tax=Psychrilyobacter piezotolerans TaxID=2293438 RepID=A0ABX9KH19_9FUSO|nr:MULTISPECIES: hypothetical protein [Psychrilyobacter]MCS5423098.1 hypothetical protein [Psychrilyobacter sp. S5]NDI77900.1 hypothetical protein [Psychrilyobacter piezotolerans]RDE62018.1 hypothetical protein DV867_07460 [Psychrilyobacter sp. S5]REI41265.1 hypothetical protein DYH56_07460 [Psychrilyobacter piezotolerans]
MDKKMGIIAVQLSKNNYRKRRKGLKKLSSVTTLTLESKAEMIARSNFDIESYGTPCKGCNDEITKILEKIKEKQKKKKRRMKMSIKK